MTNNVLTRLREYRSRLANDVNARVDKFIADGRPAEQCLELSEFIDKANKRMRLTNAAIDRIIEYECPYLEEQRALARS